MTEQTVTLRINANSSGLVTGVSLAKKETAGLGDAAEKSGERAAKGFERARAGAQSIAEQLRGAKRDLGAFIAGFVGVQGARLLGSMADQAANIRAQLQLASRGAAEYARSQSEIYAISQRTSTAMASTAELYARVTRSTAEYGIEQARVLRLTETINRTFAVSGTATAAQENAITQLTQAFAGGVMRAEEFNSVIESSPRLAQVFADGIAAAGGSVGRLRELVNDGKVDVAAMVAALEGQAAKVEEEFSRMPLTIERAWTRIRNAVLQYISESDAASGNSARVASAMSAIADNIGSLLGGALALGKAYAAIWTSRLLMSAALYTAELIAQAKQKIINTALAREMGIAQQTGMLASLKSIGLVNAALGAMGAAFAGWQIGTWLKEEFLEVELFGIALVNGLLKAWNRLKAGAALVWAGIKAAAMLSMDAITEGMANVLRSAASAGDIEIFGKRIFSGSVDQVNALADSLSGLMDPVGDYLSAQQRIATETSAANEEIDRTTGELAAAAIANRTAADAAGELADSAGRAGAKVGGLGKISADAAKQAAEFVRNLREEVETYALGADEMRRYEMGKLALTAAQRAEAEALLSKLGEWDRLTRVLRPAYDAIEDLSQGHADLDEQLARGRDVLAGLDSAQQSYNAALREHNALAYAALELGPPTAEQQAEMEERLRKLQQLLQQDRAIEAQQTMAREAQRAAEETARSWWDASGQIADAMLDGMDGVKSMFKRMLEDLKRQLLQSAIFGLIRKLFSGATSGGGGGFWSGLAGLFTGGGGSAGGFWGGVAGVAAGAAAGSSSGGGGVDAGTVVQMGSQLYSSFATSAQGANGTFSLLQMGRNIWQGFTQGSAGAVGMGSNLFGTYYGSQFAGPLPAGMSPGFNPGVGTYAAGLAGAYYGFTNRGSSNGSMGSILGGVSYGALGLGAAGAIGAGMAGGVGAMAGGATSAFASLGGAAAIPIIGSIAAIAALVDMISGGQLFGTRFRPEQATQSIGFNADGAFAEAEIREVRQRSLFRGRQWRTTALDPSAEALDAAEALAEQTYGIYETVARSLRDDVPAIMEGAIRTVTEFTSKGKVKAQKLFVDVLGRSWEVADAEEGAMRLGAEAMIDAIDKILGGLVDPRNYTLPPGPLPGTTPDSGGPGGSSGNGAPPWLDPIGDTAPKSLAAPSAASAAAQTLVGEATAIAERWRDSTEELYAGAQLLLAAATDMRAGVGLLGDGPGSLTAVVELVEELAYSGEALTDTYARLAASTQLLEQAVAMTGVDLGTTREEFVRFATGISEAAGGLDRAAALWSDYFTRYFTAEERAQYALDQASQAAERAFASAGMDLSDYRGDGGGQAFRAAFDAALASASPDDVVRLLEAANALGVLIDAEAALAQARGGVADTSGALAEMLAQVRAESASVAEQMARLGMSDLQIELREISQGMQAAEAAATALGATEAELAEIRQLAADQAALAAARARVELDDLLGGLRWDAALSGMSELERELAELGRAFDDHAARAAALGATEAELAEIESMRAARAAELIAADAQRLGEARANYQAFIAGIWRETRQLTDYQSTMQDADDWRTDAIAAAHQHARAAGMARASEQALALIELRAAQLRAQALAQLQDETQSLIDQLYGGSADTGGALTSGIDAAARAAADYWEQQRRAAASLQDYLDSMLLGDLSALTPDQKVAEAWSQLSAAAARGDADSATRLADAYLRLLRAQEASGDDYNRGFWDVRELLQGMLDRIGTLPDAPAAGVDVTATDAITPADAEAVAAQNRLDLAVQLAQHLSDLAGAIGQNVYELTSELGVDLRTLTADLGISLDTITGETVVALAGMASLLGSNLTDLTGALGMQLTQLGGGIAELAAQTGVNLHALTAESTLALTGLANQLGLDLADLAGSVGADLGSLADQQSLLNQALAAQIDTLPEGQRAALAPMLQAIAQATTDADATAAIATMSAHINTLAPDIRSALAPFFADVFPADAMDDLDWLSEIAADGAAQLAAAQTANALLDRIAANAAAANVASGVPSYAVGTGYVPRDGLAMIHQGEAIIPAPFAAWLRSEGLPVASGGRGSDLEVVAELRRIGARIEQLERTTARGAERVAGTVIEAAATSDRNADQSRARHAAATRRGTTA